MFHFRSLINAFILVIVIFGTIIGLRWYDGYTAAKKDNLELRFGEYVSQDAQKILEGFRELTVIVKEAQQSADSIRQKTINGIAFALDLYYEDNRKYPSELSELVGEYIDKKSKALSIEGLYYQKTFSGYELGVPLSTGETYKVAK